MRVLIGGAIVALVLQAGIGFTEFVLQSTAFLAPLNLTWPGIIEPAMRGVSVVQLADGARWLRAYGTLPHPKILGGLGLMLLAGPAAWFLAGRGVTAGWPPLASSLGYFYCSLHSQVPPGCGGVAAAGILAFHHRQFERKRVQTFTHWLGGGVGLTDWPDPDG